MMPITKSKSRPARSTTTRSGYASCAIIDLISLSAALLTNTTRRRNGGKSHPVQSAQTSFPGRTMFVLLPQPRSLATALINYFMKLDSSATRRWQNQASCVARSTKSWRQEKNQRRPPSARLCKLSATDALCAAAAA